METCSFVWIERLKFVIISGVRAWSCTAQCWSSLSTFIQTRRVHVSGNISQ